MFSDLITFIKTLPLQLNNTDAGAILPDSFGSLSGDALPLQKISTFFSEIGDTWRIILTLLALLAALVGCFFGYRLARMFMSLTGFLLGAAAGYYAGAAFLDAEGMKATLCALVGAVVFAFLAYRIYRAGIFILCFVLSFIAAASVLPFTGDIQFFLSTVIGFVVGSLALRYIKPVIILTSAVVCGALAGNLLSGVSGQLGISLLDTVPKQILSAALIALGALVQLLTTRSKK